MQEIQLTGGKKAIVCDCHAHLVTSRKWYAHWAEHTKSFRAARDATVSELRRGANKKKSSKKDEQLYGELVALVALMFEKFLRSILQELGYAVRTKPLTDGVVEHAANLTMEYLKQGG